MNKIFEKKFIQGDFVIYDDEPKIINLKSVRQTHSDIILLENECQNSNQEADGLIYSIKNLEDNKLAIAIKTADCLPILYLSETHVALVHAGWRGVEQKIHLHPKLLAIAPLEIFIAPSIGVNSFEVQEDFKAHFKESSHFINKSGKLYFDLVKEAQGQLSLCFPDTKITNSGICTFENNQYNSYRRDKTSKRNWNIFQTRG